MAEVVLMPKLSDTMTEGVVAEWIKKIGDEVKSGDILVEIETDKATMEFESFYDGILLYIGVEKGAKAEVNAILAIIGDKGEDIQAIIDEHSKPAEVAEEVIKEKVEPEKVIEEPVKEVVSSPAIVESVSLVTDNSRIKASPLAKKLASDKNIDLRTVKGTGSGGRIVKSDIDNYKGGGSISTPTFVGTESFRDEPVSQMRRVIASRLADSKFTAPHFYLTVKVEMDKVIDARKAIKKLLDVKVSINDLVIKASAIALREHPAVNSSWLGDIIRFNDHIHIGVAVAVEDGLLVPVVRFADGKTLTQISSEVRELAGKAKEKKLQPQEWEGNTFTISNLGMLGIEEFTAIINTPDAAILAVGGVNEVPVVRDGQVVPGHVMKLTLSCDHRVIDGVTGSVFLNKIKNLLENPVVLLGQNNI
ncbi:MAG: pyruvate dehydrogenase complex dihydrolipoamide acetyltransferase [Flavobacteriales bacterium]|nr:pyruvate dehydrogenase complex dihydrolipoamide acetyltransferase [Flavobacteriales bacterium]